MRSPQTTPTETSSTPAAAAGGRSALARAAGRCCRGLFGPAIAAADALARARVAAAPSAAARRPGEPLEPRRLLTTLFGGEEFVFASVDFEDLPEDEDDFIPVRVQVFGDPDVEVDLFGSTLQGQVSDLSGSIVQSPIPGRTGPTRGGAGGVVGSAPLVANNALFIDEGDATQAFNLTDYVRSPYPTFAQGTPGVLLATQEEIFFEAIAANSAGRTFGAQLQEIPDLPDNPTDTRPSLQIAEFNTNVNDAGGAGTSSNPFRDADAGSTDLDTRTNVGDALFLDDVIDEVIAAFGAAGDPIVGADLAEQRDNVTQVVGATFSPDDPNTLYLGVNVVLLRDAEFPPDPVDDPGEADVFAVVALDVPSPGDTNVTTVRVVATDFSADEQRIDAETTATVAALTAVGGSDEEPDLVLFGTFNRRINEGSDEQQIQAATGLLYVPSADVDETVLIDDVSQVTVLGDSPALQALAYRTGATGVAGVYGLTEAGDEQLLVRLTGQDPEATLDGDDIDATIIGGVQASGLDDDPVGESLLSLTFNPVLQSSFSGATGSFLAFDTEADLLLTIDSQARGVGGGLSLYSIVVRNSTPSTRIIISSLGDFEDPEEQGLSGSPGAVATYLVDGEPENIEVTEDTGPLYLGFKFTNDDPDIVIVYDSLDPDDLTEGTRPYTGPLYGGRVRPGLYVEDGSLGEFYFGGIVTGNVRVEGSLGEFVAGAILTGDATGTLLGGAATGVSGGGPQVNSDNFAVYGDVDSIVTAAVIGDNEVENAAPQEDPGEDDPTAVYTTGTDFAIGGRLGTIRSGGSISASFDIRGDRVPEDGFPDDVDTFYSPITGPYAEVEFKDDDEGNNINDQFANGLAVIPALYNDTFESFEPVGTRVDGDITIQGRIDSTPDNEEVKDFVDYYGIGVMAGQRISVQVPDGGVALGVFDPDGRLVTTNLDDNSQTAPEVAGSEIFFTAQTGGAYRVAIAFTNNVLFQATSNLFTAADYTLVIRDAGDIVLGGITAVNRIYSGNTVDTTLVNTRVFQGDIGIIDARNEAFFDYGSGNIIRVLDGNLRQLSGSSIGYYDEGTGDAGAASVRVAHSIGRIEATGVAGGQFSGDVFLNWTGVTDLDGIAQPINAAAGDDIQYVIAARDVWSNLTVGRGIGSIVAGRDFAIPVITSGAPVTPLIATNIDDINDDGFVDILSVNGNVGLSSDSGVVVGGPAIDMGTNGNFRYMDVPEAGTVVGDPFFGGSVDEGFRELQAGETFTFREDSGAQVEIRPVPLERNPTFTGGSTDPFDRLDRPGTIEALLYPVRSGGTILASLRTDRAVEVEIVDRGGNRAVAEVGNMFLTGDGRPVLVENTSLSGSRFTPDLRLANERDQREPTDPFDDLTVDLMGPGRVDVFSVNATGTGPNAGKFSEINNETDGEVLSVRAASIGTIDAQRVGVSMPAGLGDLIAATPIVSGFPFQEQPYAILVEGSIIEVRGDEVGNVFAGIDLPEIDSIDVGGTGGGGAGGGTGGGGGGGGVTNNPGGGGGGGVTNNPGGGGGGGVTNSPGGGGGTGGGTNTGGGGVSNTATPFIRGGQGDAIGGLGGNDPQAGGGVGGIGNVALGEQRGIIGSVRADTRGGGREERDALGFGRDDPFRFEGIAGPIVAATLDTADVVQGEIGFVDIGEGIADAGRGTFSTGGLYAEAFIVEVRGRDGADIRGDIVANEINDVRLSGGSLIGADIVQTRYGPDSAIGSPNFQFSSDLGPRLTSTTLTLFESNDTEDRNFNEIDSIRVTDGGGIIGSTVVATDLDRVTVEGGFGIIQSTFGGVDTGVFNLIRADGLGIRNVSVEPGLTLNDIVGVGDGEAIDITQFSPTVRLSEAGGDEDPFSGLSLSSANDIRRAVGLPTDVDSREQVTASGVLENVQVRAARDLGSASGTFIRSNASSVNPNFDFEDDANGIGVGNPEGSFFPMTFNLGRTIDDVFAIDTNGLQMIAGEINNVELSNNMMNTLARVSGDIDTITVARDITSDTLIRAEGPDGRVGTVTTGRDMLGRVRADQRIGLLDVGRDLGSPNAFAANDTTTESTVRSGGAGLPDSPIGTIEVGRNILGGVFIRSTDTIDRLIVDEDILSGALIQADSIGEIDVGGANFGVIQTSDA